MKTISISDKTKAKFDRSLVEFQSLTENLQTRESFVKFLLSLFNESIEEKTLSTTYSFLLFKNQDKGGV